MGCTSSKPTAPWDPNPPPNTRLLRSDTPPTRYTDPTTRRNPTHPPNPPPKPTRRDDAQPRQSISRQPRVNPPIHLQTPTPTPPRTKIPSTTGGGSGGGAWARVADRVASREEEGDEDGRRQRQRLTQARLQRDVYADLRDPEKVRAGIDDFLAVGRRQDGGGMVGGGRMGTRGRW